MGSKKKLLNRLKNPQNVFQNFWLTPTIAAKPSSVLSQR